MLTATETAKAERLKKEAEKAATAVRRFLTIYEEELEYGEKEKTARNGLAALIGLDVTARLKDNAPETFVRTGLMALDSFPTAEVLGKGDPNDN